LRILSRHLYAQINKPHHEKKAKEKVKKEMKKDKKATEVLNATTCLSKPMAWCESRVKKQPGKNHRQKPHGDGEQGELELVSQLKHVFFFTSSSPIRRRLLGVVARRQCLLVFLFPLFV